VQTLGGLLLASGVMATAGSTRRNNHLMTASLTASLVGMLLAFEFIAEVSYIVLYFAPLFTGIARSVW